MKSRTYLHFIFTLLVLAPLKSAHAIDLGKNFNFEGILLDDPAGTPMVGPVNLKFQVYDPAGVCLLFEETHTSVALVDGHFSVRVGTGTRASVGIDGGLQWRSVFVNDAQVRAPSSPGCSPGYTPAPGDGRSLRVTVGSTVLTPDFPLSSAPMATVAESLQGKVVSDFVPSAGNAVMSGPLRMASQNELRLGDASSFYVGLKGPASMGSNYTLSFPSTDGTNGQVLTTNGSGALSWTTPAGGGGITTLNGLTVGSQSFGIGSTGTTPNWSSVGSTHTLNLPMANTGGTTAGLISNTDYTTLMSKLDTAGGAVSGNLQMTSSGTSALPSLQIGPNTTNGFFSPAANTIGLSTNGQERLRIDDLGKMGIGTNGGVPDARLHIKDTNDFPLKIESNTPSVGIEFYSSTIPAEGRMALSQPATYPSLNLDAGPLGDTVPELTVQDNGGTVGARIGINQNMPAANLHLVSEGTSDQFLLQVFATAGSTATPTLNLQRARGTPAGPAVVSTGDYLGAVDFNGWDSTSFTPANPNARIAAKATENFTVGAQGTDLIFQTTQATTSSPLTRMTIKDNGNVGIGTQTPAMLLDLTASVNAAPLMNVKNMATNGVSGIQMVNSGGSMAGTIGVGNSGSSIPNRFAIQSNSIPITFVGDGIEHMRIDQNTGNVGIGTAGPTAKLDVNGPVKLGAGSDPIDSANHYPNQACTGMATVNAGLSGSCTITIGGLGGPGNNVALTCRPSGLISYPFIHSCYISGTDTITVVVQNVSGNDITFGNWHISAIKFAP